MYFKTKHAVINISMPRDYRLRLEDGTCVFVLWHNYCGPTVYRDLAWNRPIEDWWENKMICDAIDWLQTKINEKRK